MSEPSDKFGRMREIEAKAACMLVPGLKIGAHLTQPNGSENGFPR
jgi:hypothetical protein